MHKWKYNFSKDQSVNSTSGEIYLCNVSDVYYIHSALYLPTFTATV